MLGNNMFAYCGNNPITRVDFSGTAYTMTCFEIDRIPRKIPNPPSDYIESFRSDQNCYSYAFGLDGDYDPGALSGHGKMYQRGKQFYTNEELIVLIQSDIDAGYIDARKIDDPYDLNEDEYLVAMKTSTFLLPNKKHSDYHFAMLLSDGSWADKPGRADSRWNRIDGFASTWDIYGQNGYYNTDTVYFAVKKR